ncbi:TIGR03862 family flavoprotein [Pseudaestuariivita atlantica]|uniref:NAD(FAD)-utilizing dehydrogenase n=1 Tax=Pseudaestuariivita atlantica TaxID=1317121 RepID=A0A0L1JP67_9RHOB|nr:TIGR03862 family flavoprotein [Pseudaestuariivita atlantica]KNG93560.1 NAD(FAD)-utilizing dehydrogenase [Pseudaestuariivita atlantica]
MTRATALVIGAGPAGLMAAEVMAGAGLAVTVADAMPSPARKFLMAGKSGLNLTKDESGDAVLAAYHGAGVTPMVAQFGPIEVMEWAEDLGQALFVGSSGRVFPKAMKASPLLRAWLARLDGMGVVLNRRWRWIGAPGEALFDTPEGEVRLERDVVVMALGGASWARLGSDGKWAARMGDRVAPFQPSNMGLLVDWSDKMAEHAGTPVKPLRLSAGDVSLPGEIVITARGIEGGGLYAVSRPVREGATLTLDLMPDLSVDAVRARLARKRGKASLSTHLRKTLGLPAVKRALMYEFGRPLPDELAPLLKALPVAHKGPPPMDEAISTAGGLRFDALTGGLMLRDVPGWYACGEMLDWEAPTGGYLLTACLATGRWAGRHAAARALR